ncbi:hypothetical protein KIS4809_1919 [Bacillus sp. ZZV12-4809]|nr:hypothetical protein KIS4809_1919 [Bacillus sp. ZZV12-4809]
MQCRRLPPPSSGGALRFYSAKPAPILVPGLFFLILTFFEFNT